MIWVDNAIAGLLVIYAVSGLVRGYSQELFSLSVWAVAITVGWFFTNDLAILLTPYIATNSSRLAAAFVSLALITLLIGWIINLLLTDHTKSAHLTILERFGGMILGPIHGVIVAFVLVLIAGLTPLPKENWWHRSLFLPPFQSIATVVRDNIPTKLAASINYR